MGAAQAVALLSRRELSAEELVRRCLARIAEREPTVQAWEVLDAEGALAAARGIDRLRDRPPLCGLPVGVKDLIDTGDLPTAYGSPIHRGHQPEQDAECVRRLRGAGAIVLGKTVTTEFAVYTPGKTRNPHDPSRTPGGSSSGSAAAVADGRVPAALSGGPSVAIRTSKPRLGLCRTEAWPRAETETRKAIEDAARALGAREVELGPAFQGLIDAQISIMGHEASRALAGEPETELSPKLRELLREGANVTPERLRSAREQADRCRRQLDEIFATFDALLTPAATGEAPIGLAATGDPVFCRIWSLLGVPCASLPVLKGPAGLPVGLQVVGGRNREDVLLSACAWILGVALH